MDAKKNRFERSDLETVLGDASRVIIAKGKKTLEFDPGDGNWDDIAQHALGRSGTLRAPTVKRGKTVLVGFHAEAWAEVFGA